VPRKLKKSLIHQYSKPYVLQDASGANKTEAPPTDQWLAEDQRRARQSQRERRKASLHVERPSPCLLSTYSRSGTRLAAKHSTALSSKQSVASAKHQSFMPSRSTMMQTMTIGA